MTFSDSAVTDVVVDTSGETASFGAAAADELREQLMAAGSAEIDGVSGSTVTSNAVMKAAKSCYAQAKGEAVVSSVQLPTGDENDWLGTEPDIDEAAITETWDTDIVIVGAGNGGMCAAAYAAQNGLNFRLIEQNSSVMETRHWYGTIDTLPAKKGSRTRRPRQLLSEISRSMPGRCDQRVVKTWINESAAMHDFVRGILEDKLQLGVRFHLRRRGCKWPTRMLSTIPTTCSLCRSITTGQRKPLPATSAAAVHSGAKATIWTLRPVWPSWKRTARAALPA